MRGRGNAVFWPIEHNYNSSGVWSSQSLDSETAADIPPICQGTCISDTCRSSQYASRMSATCAWRWQSTPTGNGVRSFRRPLLTLISSFGTYQFTLALSIKLNYTTCAELQRDFHDASRPEDHQPSYLDEEHAQSESLSRRRVYRK